MTYFVLERGRRVVRMIIMLNWYLVTVIMIPGVMMR